MRFLFTCGMSDCVEVLAFHVWHDHITDMIHTAEFDDGWSCDNSAILHEIRAKLAHFEEEYPKLKEVTTILELALWKMKISQIENTELVGGTIPDQTPKSPTQAYENEVDTRAVNQVIDQMKEEAKKAAESKDRIKLEEASVRQQCQVTCGADVVISHVLPYLISVVDDK